MRRTWLAYIDGFWLTFWAAVAGLVLVRALLQKARLLRVLDRFDSFTVMSAPSQPRKGLGRNDLRAQKPISRIKNGSADQQFRNRRTNKPSRLYAKRSSSACLKEHQAVATAFDLRLASCGYLIVVGWATPGRRNTVGMEVSDAPPISQIWRNLVGEYFDAQAPVVAKHMLQVATLIGNSEDHFSDARHRGIYK